MRILFVGMANSVHTARWISQIADQGWDILLFPLTRWQLHPLLPNIRVFNPRLLFFRSAPKNIRSIPWLSPIFFVEALLSFLGRSTMALREKALAWVIRVYKPDLIHSLEMQHAGYLTLSARELLGGHFPTWAVTIWGSDLYLFGRLEEHQPKIKSILAHCDFFGCECSRDQVIAKEMGFQGKVLPPLPATGGFDLEYCETLKKTGPVSERREIVLKGYQHFAGRALFGFRALTLCADQLKGYQVNIFAASPEVVLAAQLFSQNTGLSVNVISTSSHETDDDSILKLFGRARISIGLSISDGIPRTMLEAMVMGAFPIQSCTACADEWIVDGEGGLIVPPEDPELIAQAIRRALSDDSMVDRAAEINARAAKERLDTNILSQQVVKIYQDIFVEGKS